MIAHPHNEQTNKENNQTNKLVSDLSTLYRHVTDDLYLSIYLDILPAMLLHLF
jgi:hypothetical protein